MIDLQAHIHQYKADPESVYSTWFVGAESRLKAFRAIRHGVKDTAQREHCKAICKFGGDHYALRKIAQFGIRTGATV